MRVAIGTRKGLWLAAGAGASGLRNPAAHTVHRRADRSTHIAMTVLVVID